MFEPTPAFVSTRAALHRVAVHVVARSREQRTGRFSLRVTPGGFGTPEHGPDQRRVRVSAGHLLVESDAPGAACGTGRPLGGATLAELASVADADLRRRLDVGHDTPPLGDVDAPLEVDEPAAAEIGRWFALVGEVLDRAVVGLAPASTTLPRLWPEHFDVAIEADVPPSGRVNLGASPGDSFCAEPYFYVGPWSDVRPGDARFWNAPFGAILPASSLGADPAGAATAFLFAGIDRLG